MENPISTQNEQLAILLARHVVTYRDELINSYQQALRKDLFINRAEVRPNMLKKIASDEAELLLSFLNQSELSVTEHGSKLYQTGLSERVVLRLGQVTRLFFVSHLENDQIASMLKTVEDYQEMVIQGFVQSLEKYYFDELERTRNALQRGNS
jgi:translation elongation factor EF-G